MATAQPDTTEQQTDKIEIPDSTGISTEDTQAKDPDLEAKIIKQIEFYFGDKNLPRDKYLLRILHEEGNEAGWVALENILNFNRLKKLSTDIPFIATALRQSTSGLLEVFEDNTKIRRITPLPETSEFAFFDHSKSIYAKGFPLESTIDELENKKTFKGSVFIEFAEESVATDFVKDDTISYKDTELIRLMKKDYLEKKAIEHQEYKKKQRIEKSEQLREKVQHDIPFLKGALLKLEGLPNTTRRENIKDHFGRDKVRFVDMKIGDEDCVVMFNAENGAVDAIGSEEDTIKFGESMIKYKILDGEDEQKDWVRICQCISSMGKRQKMGGLSRGGGRGKWGGRSNRGGGRRGRGGFRSFQKKTGEEDDEKVALGKRSRNEDEPKAKHTRMAGSDED
ncbi:Lupus La protein-like [Oopsacas minuta]|uniref:Lupus La protein-like n=1 Tax=Oopsacas minuta TaxID=111878 RepID=A0AAV7JQ10_9METZ|nr:Lupus La protein-like [Oopsacas minuta]